MKSTVNYLNYEITFFTIIIINEMDQIKISLQSHGRLSNKFCYQFQLKNAILVAIES